MFDDNFGKNIAYSLNPQKSNFEKNQEEIIEMLKKETASAKKQSKKASTISIVSAVFGTIGAITGLISLVVQLLFH